MKFLIVITLGLISSYHSVGATSSLDDVKQAESILDEAKPLNIIHKIKTTKVAKRLHQLPVKYLNDVLSIAEPDEVSDMEELLQQLNFVPYKKDPLSGAQVFKVTAAAKSSLFERAGIKVGDLIVNGSSSEN